MLKIAVMIGLMMGLFGPWSGFAADTVSLVVNPASISISSQENGSSDYQALIVKGHVSQVGTHVVGMPLQLPETVKIMFRANNIGGEFLATRCEKYAYRAAESTKFSLQIDVKVNSSNQFPKLIQKSGSGFGDKAFVIRQDDERVLTVSCGIEGRSTR